MLLIPGHWEYDFVKSGSPSRFGVYGLYGCAWVLKQIELQATQILPVPVPVPVPVLVKIPVPKIPVLDTRSRSSTKFA